jgi:hypothetical protein
VKSRSKIIGSIFFEDTINAERYCELILCDFTCHFNEEHIARGSVQQYGATPHTTHVSMALLRGLFGERLISRGIWPPRSPDLSPPDFYMWGA